MPLSVYVQSIIFWILAAVPLFGGAGSLDYPTFWAYLVIFAGVLVGSFVWIDPDLARERLRPGGQKPPMALRLFSGVLILHWLVAGLDRGRFHWSDSVPDWLQILSLVLLASSYALSLWAMHVNRFFSSVVRIQSDRGQRVISTGPYAYVRHPGYLAGIVVMLTSGLALGSWLATAVLLAPSVPFLMYRVVTEDRVLHEELAGYGDYAARVRWRLLPGVW